MYQADNRLVQRVEGRYRSAWTSSVNRVMKCFSSNLLPVSSIFGELRSSTVVLEAFKVGVGSTADSILTAQSVFRRSHVGREIQAAFE